MSTTESIFDNLPLEIYQFIFENYLDLNDLFRLALVNKRFNFIVKQCRMQELIFENGFKYRYNWFGINESIDLKRVIDKSKLFVLLKNRQFNLDSLRRLKIDHLRDSFKISLKTISELKRLEVLEIFLDQCKRKDNMELCLPELKVLSFLSNCKYTIVHFDLPKLEILDINCHSLKSITFSNPFTVRKLKTYDFKIELSLFINIEQFECYSSFQSEVQSIKILHVFPKLKELFFEDSKNLKFLLREKTRLNRTDLNIYYKSVRMNDLSEFKMNERFYIQYYNELMLFHMLRYSRLSDNMNWVTEVNYCKQMNFNSLPKDFFNRFKNIQKIFINHHVTDANDLIKFIGNCRNLGHLCIQSGRLDQQFYDQIPQITYLFKLEIIEFGLNNYELNYDFINRMYYLKEFRTDLNGSKEIFELFRNKNLIVIGFAINRICICVEKMRDNKYILQDLNKSILYDQLDYKSLLQSFDYLNKGNTTRTRSQFKKMKFN